MNKKIHTAINIILPNKKTNYFLLGILTLGIIFGSIFLTIINDTDKTIIITKITEFFSSVNTNTLNNTMSLKNSLIFNNIYIILMWILGLSLIGLIINIFLFFIRGFILGFSISSIILTYKYKGIIASILYIFPHHLINIITCFFITSYTIVITKYLIGIILKKKNNDSNIIKKYFYILIISIILTLISSFLEVYLFPALLKLIIKLYI